ncbi:MAG: FmdB family zinc ribbon protein [Gemmatimonadales bacterium]
MPTYEYQCSAGHDFEKVQKMSDPSKARCPVCGKQATRKISGGAGLVFKGSGFYITDYGKDGKGPRKPEKAESGTDSSAGTGDKPAKPAKDTPAKPAAAPKKAAE